MTLYRHRPFLCTFFLPFQLSRVRLYNKCYITLHIPYSLPSLLKAHYVPSKFYLRYFSVVSLHPAPFSYNKSSSRGLLKIK